MNWASIGRRVKRLQMRIAKATRERRWGKVKALQWLLTHSYDAKLLAVRRVVSNPGRRTAGVDGCLWTSSAQRLSAARSLQRRGYKPSPLRRIYIPKSDGRKRPLGIPTMKDRAMQALYLLALEPVAEMTADLNSYGFRPRRSPADAIVQCYFTLCRRTSSQWVLEGDIKSCFDRISHDWLMANIPMDTVILSRWLAAGYMEKGSFYPQKAGTPQGGIASPVLANMALDGLERVVKQGVPPGSKVHVIRYADDFVITAPSKELLEQIIQPVVEQFLERRGLELSLEKTKITHIREGFDFLGITLRKYHKDKCLTKPSKRSVMAFLRGVRAFVKSNKTATMATIIQKLNPKIRGWSQYHCHSAAKSTFSYVDAHIFRLLWAWARRRHPNKGRYFIAKRYFHCDGTSKWRFATFIKDTDGQEMRLELLRASDQKIIRHVKIKAQASPYDPRFTSYLKERAKRKRDGLPNPWDDRWI